MTNGTKTRAELQAEVDAARLLLLMAAAQKRGLMKKGAVDVEACQDVIDDGANNDIRPRHDLLTPALLLADFADIRDPRVRGWERKENVTVSVTLHKRDRSQLVDFAPIWQVIQESADNGVPDIALSKEGLVVRMEGQYYVLQPPEIYVAVASAFGLNMDKLPVNEKRRPKPDGQWRMRFGEEPE